MRPPLITEQDVRVAIREIAGRERVTGVRVRAWLAAHRGARGGVARVYRLMREIEGAVAAPSPRPVARPAGIRDESREEAIARADLAEHRERVHQERWARETDELRTRLAAAELAARSSVEAERRIAELRQALAAAHARIAALERAAAGET